MNPHSVSKTPAPRSSWPWPVIGTLIAIAVSVFMDLIGISNFNALPLIPLFFLLWYLQHFSRIEIGLTWGQLRDYGLAVFYPLLVLALIGLIAWLSGAAKFGAINWADTLGKLALELALTIIFGIVTEEGIFRGWLWASLQRAGVSEVRVLVLTAVAFAAWHVPDVVLPTDFRPPAAQAPIYILNVVAIGIIWAFMRKWSGSIVVTSVSHGVWNAFAYVLFGVGSTTGVLGIHNTAVFGPEVGLVGLGVNLAFAAVLWLGFSRARGLPAIEMTRP